MHVFRGAAVNVENLRRSADLVWMVQAAWPCAAHVANPCISKHLGTFMQVSGVKIIRILLEATPTVRKEFERSRRTTP